MRHVALILMLCVVSWAEEGAAPPPAATAPAAEVVTIGTIVQYPRSVDTMARLWMTLYQACQTAGVPAGEVVATFALVPFEIDKAFKVAPKPQPAKPVVQQRSDAVVCVVAPEALSKLIGALLPAAGPPRVYLKGKNLYAGWVWGGAWPGQADDFPGELLRWPAHGEIIVALQLFLCAQVETFTPELVDVIAKYGKQ